MALKTIVNQKILDEVITIPESNAQWRVLIVDQLGMKMISACCKMHDISAKRITLVESIFKKREPIAQMEAIYFLTPMPESIQALIVDFRRVPMYKCAHVFFIGEIPQAAIERIATIKKHIRTFKEVNIAFIPYEEQVFHLDYPESFKIMYSYTDDDDDKIKCRDRIAEQLATVCATLNEYPSILYQKNWDDNKKLALQVAKKLAQYKKDDARLGESHEKVRSQLLILNRSFDCISPLLHELTYQAMTYDLLDIDGDVYTYTSDSQKQKDVILDENDEVWCELRHQHIAKVSLAVNSKMKNFKKEKHIPSTLRNLSEMIKKMPQFQKQLSKCTTHVNLANDCMQQYNNFVNKICEVEQDLAMGMTADGDVVKDYMQTLLSALLNINYKLTDTDKIRLIGLYALAKNGAIEDNLMKLGANAQVKVDILKNLNRLGAQAITVSRNPTSNLYPRRKREVIEQYKQSRWIPIVKDIMEDAIDGKLNGDYFDYATKRDGTVNFNVPMSARYGNWSNREKKDKITKNLPRLIVFINGGVTYSELRTAYEVTCESKQWQVVIGSTHLITPKSFLKDLATL